jgi:hypothetical protein
MRDANIAMRNFRNAGNGGISEVRTMRQPQVLREYHIMPDAGIVHRCLLMTYAVSVRAYVLQRAAKLAKT